MPEHADRPTWIVLGREGGTPTASFLDHDAHEFSRMSLPDAEVADWVAAREAADAPRWVWNDTMNWYPALLRAGVRVARCHDLRLCHVILRDATADGIEPESASNAVWARPAVADGIGAVPETLFDLVEQPRALGPPSGVDDAVTEFARQATMVAATRAAARLRLLLAAESAGALIAAELHAAGVPWDAKIHDGLLTAALGERPTAGAIPSRMAQAASEVREALSDPVAGLDSQPKLLRALHRAGVFARSTSRWELAQYDHPVIAPLLRYKQLARLYTANGWAWLDEWVQDHRFRPVYLPGGVVTGRWASSGGGAMQIPRQLRQAVRADPGWRLVIADVAQLEPRVLAAMAGDLRLAQAAKGRDLYGGIVDSGVIDSRSEAKVAMLGAMYGATRGDSGRLLPKLRAQYPQAMAVVDAAARTGERGGVVATWLGRTSPTPSPAWNEVQNTAGDVTATADDESRARRSAGERGRFTRNFVVQGTAAEWALVWLAHLRVRLWALPSVGEAEAAPESGTTFERRAHLAFFLHDEVIVHTPAHQADLVADAVRASAAAAGQMLFGDFPIDFPLDLRIVETADKN